MFSSLFRRKHAPHVVHDDEKPLDKTGEITEDTNSSSYINENSSWILPQEVDTRDVAVTPFPDSPHLIGIDADDETSSISGDLRYNNISSSGDEAYDGSKPFVEWLSSRDVNSVMLTSPPSPQEKHLVFHSANVQVEEGSNIISPGFKRMNNERNEQNKTTLPQNVCYHGDEIARILSESCGCTIITQLNDLLDTRHCDGDVQDNGNDNDRFNKEAVEVPLDNEIEREEKVPAEKEDSCCASYGSGVYRNAVNDEASLCTYETKNREDHLFGDTVTPDRVPKEQHNDVGDPSHVSAGNQEEFPVDEACSSIITQYEVKPRKNLSQMLLDSSMFQPNNNPWNRCYQPDNKEWRSGCSVNGDDINTLDLESLDDVLNDHGEEFRETKPGAPSSQSRDVHLLGAYSAASSTSSDHGSVFDKVLDEVNGLSVKSVEETKPQRKLDLSPTSKDSAPYRSRPVSRRSSFSSKETDSNIRAKDSSRKKDNYTRRSSSRSNDEEPKDGKENTIIVMSIRSRRGKERYGRHARMQRLASKSARPLP